MCEKELLNHSGWGAAVQRLVIPAGCSPVPGLCQVSSTAPIETMLGTLQPSLEQEIRINGSLMVVLSRRPVDAGWEDERMSGHLHGTGTVCGVQVMLLWDSEQSLSDMGCDPV